MLSRIEKSLVPELKAEVLPLAANKRGMLTILAYVARFAEGTQREAYEVLGPLGARGAKRFVECNIKPPTVEDMVRRISGWLTREFPPRVVDMEDLASACKLVAENLLARQEGPTEGPPA